MPITRVDPEASIRTARDQYLADNGFTTASYTDSTFTLPILGRQVPFPNPPARQAVISRHDLHHVLVGYGTDYAGEGEISVWELRGGCPTAFLVFINSMAMLGGIVVAPRRMWRAWRQARGCRTLYVDDIDYDAALDMRVVDLRRRLGLPDAGIAPRADGP